MQSDVCPYASPLNTYIAQQDTKLKLQWMGHLLGETIDIGVPKCLNGDPTPVNAQLKMWTYDIKRVTRSRWKQAAQDSKLMTNSEILKRCSSSSSSTLHRPSTAQESPLRMRRA
ncbi:jg24093 [Pararge aegeria aegeria]|uniref:Jg24093 protein n=1 Tax=Pararge aegeria aegeria TaxID=348720 RepID=A0A8S4QYT2_9NEOP|nr:jg24093 [Pararge aegeria aegeria]